MPALLVAVEAKGLRELRVPARDLVRDVVGLPEARLLGAEGRVEETDRCLLLLGAVPADGDREIELLVIHACAPLLQEAKPEGGGAVVYCGHVCGHVAVSSGRTAKFSHFHIPRKPLRR